MKTNKFKDLDFIPDHDFKKIRVFDRMKARRRVLHFGCKKRDTKFHHNALIFVSRDTGKRFYAGIYMPAARLANTLLVEIEYETKHESLNGLETIMLYIAKSKSRKSKPNKSSK